MIGGGVSDRVILLQVRAAGLAAPLAPRDLTSLRRAGATDTLLEELLSLGSVDDARYFTHVGEDGRRVLYFTNLDQNGRRIGGEVERPVRANVVVAATPAEPRRAEPPGRATTRRARAESSVEPEAWVAPDDAGEDVDEETVRTHRGEFPSLPVGTPVPFPGFFPFTGQLQGAGLPGVPGLPGTPAGFAPGFAGTPWSGWGFPTVPLTPVSPPGSWSHYLKYHHGEESTIRRTHRQGP